MAIVTRGMTLTYGTLSVGGTSEYYLLHGDPPVTIEQAYDRLRVTAHVVCRSTSVSDFDTKADALEVAFRKPNQDLSITFGATTRLSVGHSAGTGFLARAECVKVGSVEFDSDISALYRLEVTAQLPADLTGKNGLREGRTEILTEANGRRLVTISGTITATSGTSAATNYATAVAALTTAVGTALSATLETTDDRYAYDDESKVITFTRTLVEVIFAQSSAGTDHASIKNQQLTITRDETQDGDHDGNGPPVTINIQYACDVDKSSTTDLATLWNGTIKPWVLTQARTVANAGAIAVTRLAPQYDKANNRIMAQVTLIAVVNGTTWGRRVETSTTEETGVTLVPVWNGNPFARKKYNAIARRTIEISDRLTRFGGSSSSGGTQPAGGGSGAMGWFGFQVGVGDQRGQLGQINVTAPGGASTGSGVGVQGASGTTGAGGVRVPPGYELIRRVFRSYPQVLGLRQEQMITVSIEATDELYEYAEVVTGEASGGGTGGYGGTVIR